MPFPNDKAPSIITSPRLKVDRFEDMVIVSPVLIVTFGYGGPTTLNSPGYVVGTMS